MASLYLLVLLVAVGVWLRCGIVFGDFGRMIKEKIDEYFKEDEEV